MGFDAKLELDTWYKVGVYIAAAALLGSLFFPLQIGNRLSLLYISSGALLLCLSIWQGMAPYAQIHNVGGQGIQVQGNRFQWTIFGIASCVVSIILISYGVYLAIF